MVDGGAGNLWCVRPVYGRWNGRAACTSLAGVEGAVRTFCFRFRSEFSRAVAVFASTYPFDQLSLPSFLFVPRNSENNGEFRQFGSLLVADESR